LHVASIQIAAKALSTFNSANTANQQNDTKCNQRSTRFIFSHFLFVLAVLMHPTITTMMPQPLMVDGARNKAAPITHFTAMRNRVDSYTAVIVVAVVLSHIHLTLPSTCSRLQSLHDCGRLQTGYGFLWWSGQKGGVGFVNAVAPVHI
jgi:hypothetical protein